MKETEKAAAFKSATKKKRGIVKAKSEFFREAQYGLTTLEHRIIYFAILTGQQAGTPFEPVTVPVREFIDVCGLSSATYSQLKGITHKLIQKNVEVVYHDEKGRHLMQATWVTSVKYHERDGSVTITPNPELKPFFDNPRRNYSTTEFYFLVKFTCQYSERLYELMKSFDFKSIIDFDIEELRDKMAVKNKYPNYTDFRSRVLSPAVEDINTFTDLDIDFRETRGEYNKVTVVTFSLHKKKVDLLYDREQRGELISSKAPIEGQTSFWETFDFLKEGDVGVLIDKGDKSE